VLADGERRAVVSHDLRGHETPAWLLTSYEGPSPATSSRIGETLAGSGPTPPESEPSSGSLSTGTSISVPGNPIAEAGGPTSPPNSGAPDTSMRPGGETVNTSGTTQPPAPEAAPAKQSLKSDPTLLAAKNRLAEITATGRGELVIYKISAARPAPRA
jgi:hypothetical protein